MLANGGRDEGRKEGRKEARMNLAVEGLCFNKRGGRRRRRGERVGLFTVRVSQDR